MHQALVNKSLRERRDLLHDAFIPVEGEFAFAKYGDTSDLDEIQTLLDDSVKAGCEGLMVKMLDGPASSYEPSKRSQNWLKVKKDYLAGVGDSLGSGEGDKSLAVRTRGCEQVIAASVCCLDVIDGRVVMRVGGVEQPDQHAGVKDQRSHSSLRRSSSPAG